MAVVAAAVAVVGLAVGIGGTVAAQQSARKSRSIQKRALVFYKLRGFTPIGFTDYGSSILELSLPNSNIQKH
mgnify:CR=1 FL=1